MEDSDWWGLRCVPPLSTSRPGLPSRNSSNATMESSADAGASAFIRRALPEAILRSTASANTTESARDPHTRRSCLRERTASPGASSESPKNCHGSRTEPTTRRNWSRFRIGESRVARRQGSPAPRCLRGCSLRSARPHRRFRRWSRRGLSRRRRFGSRRLSLPRCAVDVRTTRLRARTRNWQAPLGRLESRGSVVVEARHARCLEPVLRCILVAIT
jgi:hypothetical protein